MSPFIYYLLSAPSPNMTEWAMPVLFSQNPQCWVIAPTQQAFATHLVKDSMKAAESEHQQRPRLSIPTSPHPPQWPLFLPISPVKKL